MTRTVVRSRPVAVAPVASSRLAYASLALLALAALVLVPSRAHAQRPSVARLTPYVGYMTFGDYIDGPIGTRISNANSAVYGVTGGDRPHAQRLAGGEHRLH
jgi:hypothetical protein